jgi:hypothetical protein
MSHVRTDRRTNSFEIDSIGSSALDRKRRERSGRAARPVRVRKKPRRGRAAIAGRATPGQRLHSGPRSESGQRAACRRRPKSPPPLVDATGFEWRLVRSIRRSPYRSTHVGVRSRAPRFPPPRSSAALMWVRASRADGRSLLIEETPN